MAASSSNTAGQTDYDRRNAYDGLRAVLPALAASGEQIYHKGRGFESPATPASAASHSRMECLPYDVYISQNGADVVTSRIYNSLVANGLKVFLQKNELNHRDAIPRPIEEAMISASIYIAIFSEHYAESPPCLAELCLMLQTGTKIIPVYYNVEPSTLRWAIEGQGMYADAFSKYEMKSSDEHETKRRYSSEQLRRWKWALHKASFLTGHIINSEDNKHRVVTNVVNYVIKEMNKAPLEVARHPVGLDEAVQVVNMIALKSGGSIQIVGIWGLGGSGKTTLAKKIFKSRCSSANRSSFLFDLRDAAGKGLLVEKQKKLLEDLDVKCKSFDNVDEGKGILKSSLRSVSTLIILDDVDHTDQLDALLPARESLGKGSLIVVTTRELDVLIAWGISAIYEMRPLNATHAKQLFCWHAFLQPSPLSGFEDLVEKFLHACKGLPLSLKVLGAQLWGTSCKDYWQSLLHKVSRILPADIKLRLKVSYDCLDDEEKEMFLDIACFFIGHSKSVAITVWEGSGWSGLHGWERLFNKCLVEMGDCGEIQMHDHLRDLGREIANGRSPYRLWSPLQCNQIHSQQEGIQIRGMANAFGDNCYLRQGNIIIRTNVGERSLVLSLLGLKIFVGNGDIINQEYSKISRELIWLRCNEIDHKHLPSGFSFKKLRILELFNPRSLEYLWEHEGDAPLQLRELVIQRCNSLREFPRSIGHLKNLKKILISQDSANRDTLTSLPQEFCHLQSLEHLEIKWCRNLSSLPGNFGELTNLQHVNLNGCSMLRTLPDSFKKLVLLEYLNLEGCCELIIKSELHVLENMTKLKYLNLNECKKLEELCLPKGTSITELYLRETGLKELPNNIFEQTKLFELQIGSEFLTTWPSSLGNLSSLTTLEIHRCPKLEYLPDFLEHLNFLRDLDIQWSAVKCLPKSLIHLQRLKIFYTPINELSFGLGCTVKKIHLFGTEVSKISICGDCCPFLENLSLDYNKDLRELETLPATLKTIYISHCDVLKDITGVRGLKNLQKLEIKFCEQLDVLPCFGELASLEIFRLEGCSKVKKIVGLQELTSLQELSINDCPELDRFPSLELISLKEFDLRKCHKLEKIESLKSLRSLETLKIRDCPELDRLPSLEELVSLKEFDLRRCDKLEKIEGLEQLRSLEKLEVHSCWNAPCTISLENSQRLKSLVIVAKDRSAVEPFVSNIQTWPREVITCTRAVFDVGSLKNLFELPNVSVLYHSDLLQWESNEMLSLRRPESSTNANAILICFIIDCVYSDLHFSIYPTEIEDSFITELGKGKWVWMGVFTQGSPWLRSYREIIERFREGKYVEAKVENAWVVMGEEQSIIEAFHWLFQRKLPGNIKQRLKMSYDALDEDKKQMFLDTACFFIGEEKSLAIAVWDGSGWSGSQGLESLINKYLVYLDENNRIRMHDDLRDLGREIAEKQSPPYRLWSPWHFNQIQSEQRDIEIRGMVNATGAISSFSQGKIIINTNEGFCSLTPSPLGLKLLVCSGQFLNQEVGELSRELLWLRCHDFNHSNLPPWLSLENLRVLELNDALNLQELWTDVARAPLQLRELNITGTWSASFEGFPSSISCLNNMKKIALLGDAGKEFGIKGLPQEFCDLSSLEHLELRYCTFLSSLPARFGDLRNLRHLDLCSCQMLRKLPTSFKKLVNLEYLDFSYCKKLSPMLDILENMRKLENLSFSRCPKMQELPLQIVEQEFLRELHLKKTMLMDLPNNIGQLSNLQKLVIGSPHLTGFPESLGNLSSLTRLKITGCINLEILPESVERLKHLQYFCIKSSGVRSLPEGFKQLTNLQNLKIFDCPIAELHLGTGSSSSLSNLKAIHIKATDVTRLSISKNSCPNLEILKVELNRRLIEIDILPTSVKMVKVYECPMLHNINGISGLVELETMEITGCPELHSS